MSIFLRAALTLCAAAPAIFMQDSDDYLRAVNVERYGIATRVPQAWVLTNWARNGQAFYLRIPQDPGSALGYVKCDLGISPERMEDLRKQFEAEDKSEKLPAEKLPRDANLKRLFEIKKPVRKLVYNKVEKLDPKAFNLPEDSLKEVLKTHWEYTTNDGARWYEERICLVSHGHLYIFTLGTDEAHYDAYRLDFADTLKRIKFSPPQTGLKRLAGGFWMQREFRFAMWLPAEWTPSLAPRDNVLLYATGAGEQAFSEDVRVRASQPTKLDFKDLKSTLPEQITKRDEQAKVISCEIVPYGKSSALETVFRTRRDGHDVTILERRFQTERYRYEVKYTCLTSRYAEIRDELAKSLASFRETGPEDKGVF